MDDSYYKQITPAILQTSDLDDICAFNIADYNDGTPYPIRKGMTANARSRRINEMFRLLTNMILKGAKSEEIVRVCKYLKILVDIDRLALNWVRSMEDLGIQELKDSYGTEQASCLIFRKEII